MCVCYILPPPPIICDPERYMGGRQQKTVIDEQKDMQSSSSSNARTSKMFFIFDAGKKSSSRSEIRYTHAQTSFTHFLYLRTTALPPSMLVLRKICPKYHQMCCEKYATKCVAKNMPQMYYSLTVLVCAKKTATKCAVVSCVRVTH